ncbi:hypothetical protein Dda_6948 [Drechslerella dactyloides]|uniref:Uncharacterized protein n=1 Tax=Drechslerella dactyloides TaxID=74499 RepID=A0AAD6ITF4_DREDA|nr:hypothetical protein Dda_6948 [Drechslerella dactyloides]
MSIGMLFARQSRIHDSLVKIVLQWPMDPIYRSSTSSTGFAVEKVLMDGSKAFPETTFQARYLLSSIDQGQEIEVDVSAQLLIADKETIKAIKFCS